MADKQYFAILPGSEIGKEIKERVEKYFRSLESSGHLDTVVASIRSYYGTSFNSTGGSAHYISRGGKFGQLRKVRVNHVRNLGLHLLQLTTSQRPAPQPVAINSDASSQEAATVARGVIDYYSRFKKVDRLLQAACERAIVTGEGFVDASWDNGSGEAIGLDEAGIERKSGDLAFRVLSALEVAREVKPGSDGIGDWVVMIYPANRYDLVAKYAPAQKDENGQDIQNEEMAKIKAALLGAPTINADTQRKDRRPWGAILTSNVPPSDDCISVMEFRHRKTPACPKGRLVKMTEDGTVFQAADLPFEDLNLRRLSAGEIMDTPFSYGPLFDLLAIQEIVDALYSAVASNQMTFATQLIFALKSADFDYRQLAHGISLLEGNDPDSEPKPLNLTQTPAEVFKFIEQLERAMETISGVNATVRGNPEFSLKSGSALATVQLQAIQFVSVLQGQYASLVEDTYTDMLGLLQEHALDPRQIIIIGKFNKPYVKSFQSKDIEGIKRVIVDAGPAVSQTTAFKTEVARDLLQNGLIKRPEEYLAVVNTGRLEPLIEGDNAELMLIQKENEYLKEGKPVYALPIDKHLLHIQEHRCAAADPEARMDAARVKALSDHILEHVRFLSDPSFAELMMVLGETPLGAAAIPPETMAGGTPSGSPPGKPSGPPTQPQNASPKEAQNPQLPSTPDGTQWEPQMSS